MHERYKLMRKQMTKNLNNIITNVVANEMIENQDTAIEAVYAAIDAQVEARIENIRNTEQCLSHADEDSSDYQTALKNEKALRSAIRADILLAVYADLEIEVRTLV